MAMALERTETMPMPPEMGPSSSWSSESMSKWVSLSGNSDSALFENEGVEHWVGSEPVERHSNLGRLLNYDGPSSPYPETHFTYGHPDLIYNLNSSTSSPPSAGRHSPTSHSVYDSSDSSNGHFEFWEQSAPGSALPSQLNSRRASPMPYTSHLPVYRSEVNSPFMASPVANSPLAEPLPILHVDSPPEHYVNLSDVASLGDPASSSGYHSPYFDGDRISAVTRALVPQEEKPSKQTRGRKRGHEETEVETPAKRSRGRPRKKLFPTTEVAESLIPSPSPSTKQLAADDEGVLSSDDDGDSDLYIPSRSASPSSVRRGRGNRRASSNTSFESGNSRRRPNGTGAARSLRQLEEAASTEEDKGLAIHQDQKTTKRRNIVPVPNLLKKSRGRKVPVDEEVVEDVQEPISAPPANHSSSLYALPETATTAYSLRSVGAEGEFPAYDEGMYYRSDPSGEMYQSIDAGYQSIDTSQPIQGRPPALGRQVVTSDTKVVSGGIKKSNGDRRYVCTAAGCGKCFVRGEHLKRHVRSLHTWEKPHKCPHPGCNKSFSRRDNLGQHARVHL